MRKNGLDIELRKSILKCLEDGIGYKAIAKDFGISVYTGNTFGIFIDGEIFRTLTARKVILIMKPVRS